MTMRDDETPSGREPALDADPDVISDAGMKKDLRQNMVEIDVMAVRAIAKAGRMARGEATNDSDLRPRDLPAPRAERPRPAAANDEPAEDAPPPPPSAQALKTL